MDITYFALQPVQVGDEIRMPGQLVPEARDWAHLWAYLNRGEIAPVLVATLPKVVQDTLARWEQDQQGDASAATQAVQSSPVVNAPDVSEEEASEATSKEEAPVKGSQKVKV